MTHPQGGSDAMSTKEKNSCDHCRILIAGGESTCCPLVIADTMFSSTIVSLMKNVSPRVHGSSTVACLIGGRDTKFNVTKVNSEDAQAIDVSCD